MKVGLLIPAYNEKDQLPFLLEEIKTVLSGLKDDFEVIIVDDGSDDGTTEYLKEILENNYMSLPLKIIFHEHNKGVSAAFRTGFDYVLGDRRSFDLLITMEANKNADPSVIPAMLRASGACDLILASCYAPGGGLIGDPIHRMILSKGINWVLRILFPCHDIHTYTSFYRLWRVEVLKWLYEDTSGVYFLLPGFVCMADALIRVCKRSRYRISEIPIVLISDIDNDGSKMNITKTILGYLKLILTYLWS